MNLRRKIILMSCFAVLVVVSTSGIIFFVRHSILRSSANSQKFFTLAMAAMEMQRQVVEVQQFLTNISATRGGDGLDEGFKEADNSRKAFLDGIEVFRDAYRQRGDKSKIGQLDAIVNRFDTYYQKGRKMAQAYIDGGVDSGNKLMGGFDQAADQLNQVFLPFVQENVSLGDSELHNSDTLLTTLFWSGIAMVLLVLLAAPLAVRSLLAPLKKISDDVQSSAEQVAAAAGQIATSSQSLAQGASEQSSSLDQIAANIKEVSTMISNDAGNLQQADALVKDSGSAMAMAEEGMKRLKSAMAEISAASLDTQKIVGTIDEIAFQTNLLALNAAVEAARAGEAGAGFAVVADEVRNLAMRAAEAARTTSHLIEGTVKKVGDGDGLVNEVSETFVGAAQGATKLGSIVVEVAASAQDQAQAMDQVRQAMGQIETVTHDQAATAEEAASASEQMSAQAEMMRDIAFNLDQLVGGSGTRGSMGHEPTRKSLAVSIPQLHR